MVCKPPIRALLDNDVLRGEHSDYRQHVANADSFSIANCCGLAIADDNRYRQCGM